MISDGVEIYNWWLEWKAAELLNGPPHAISAKITIGGKDSSSCCGHVHIVEELNFPKFV